MSSSSPVKTLLRAVLWETPKLIFAPFILVGAAIAGVFKWSFGWVFELVRKDKP